MSMFCRQCEQTVKGTGCNVQGVCGKDQTTAILQDVLTYSIVGIGIYGKLARDLGVIDEPTDLFVIEGF